VNAPAVTRCAIGEQIRECLAIVFVQLLESDGLFALAVQFLLLVLKYDLSGASFNQSFQF
jgi:hypothetical protein